jgi:hypothetical protein
MAKSWDADFVLGNVGVLCDLSVSDSWPPVWFGILDGSARTYFPAAVLVSRHKATRSVHFRLVVGPVSLGIVACRFPWPQRPGADRENSNTR